jgi:hypothetical protein
MPKQTSSIKAIGTVEEVSFYEEDGDYRARAKTGVDTHRFKTDKAFGPSRASSDRFGTSNTLWSLVYRYTLPDYKSQTLCSLCRNTGIALIHQHLGDEEVLRRLFDYMDSLHCLSVSREDFELLLPILLREAVQRALNKEAKQKKKKAEVVTFIISKPVSEEDKELFIHETGDFKWQAVFAGTFPKDYEIPICFLGHVVDEFKGLRTTLEKPTEKIRTEWVRRE